MDLKKTIRKYSLQNAVKFSGRASGGAVIGKVLSEKPELKKDMKNVSKEIQDVLKEVNSLSLDKQKQELEEYSDELKKPEKKEKDIFSMFKIEKKEKVVTAFPPEPSKYPHIGHAKSIFLNYELARKFNGKFMLRFEDTNPKLVNKEFYKIHLENYEWLGIKPDKVDYASDHMEEFYEYAKDMVYKGNAYLCECNQDDTKKNRFKGIECNCRSLSAEEKFDDFFKAEEGKIVLRLKGDMQHKNSTMRDPALLRVIDHEHPRLGKKYRVWPTYDFENSIMDGIEGITHRLRTKEFELRNELQNFLQTLLGFKPTKIFEFGRFNLEGVESSGRVIRELIEKKKLVGWDDPSLTTLVALRRRGFLPEAIKNFVISTGITKAESILTWDDLIVHNRRLLDKSAKRYFFISYPKKILIENSPEMTVKLKIHPESKEKGLREFKVNEEFYISDEDFVKFKDNELIRLMDCINFKKEGSKFIFHSIEHEKFKGEGKLIIHWLPVRNGLVEAEILMQDKKLIQGIAESRVKDLKEGEVLQFSRFGFCRLDKKDKMKFWYTHK